MHERQRVEEAEGVDVELGLLERGQRLEGLADVLGWGCVRRGWTAWLLESGGGGPWFLLAEEVVDVGWLGPSALILP